MNGRPRPMVIFMIMLALWGMLGSMLVIASSTAQIADSLERMGK